MRAAACLPLVALALLAGCGQKGPLYLPDKGGALVTPAPSAPPGATPAPAQSAPAPQDTPDAPKKNDKDDDSKAPH